MLPIAYYLLKVIICSGILYAYYWLLLRNKVFHGYNRFYLMASIVLSLLLPLIKISFWQPQQQDIAGVIKMLQAVSYGDEYMENITITSGSDDSFDFTQLYPFVYLLVSVILLVVFLHTLYIIFSLLKKYPKQTIDKISFINTDAKSTPFSFLNYIFWNHNIDVDTATGNQIFKHELAHVQEGHTYDKLFINIILIFFWCNPFYWLYRKELNMIHEFIADKKAVEDNDTEAFAAMILQATYPQHRFQLTNNFFYSPIKRRLLMLTKNKNPKVNYFGRVMVLPLLLLIFAAFTFKIKSETNKHGFSTMNDKAAEIKITQDAMANKLAETIQAVDSPPRSVFINSKHADSNYLKTPEFRTKALCVVDGKEMGNLGMTYVKTLGNYNSITVYNPENAKKEFGTKGNYGAIKLTQKDLTLVKADSICFDKDKNIIKLNGNANISGNLDNTVIYVDGKISSAEDLNKIAPSTISSINITKGERLNEIMETKGKDAIINIQLKPAALAEVVVEGFKTKTIAGVEIAKAKPLYVVNNVVQENFNLNNLAPNNIETINVLKDEKAIAKYGNRAINGVIEITTKDGIDINAIKEIKITGIGTQQTINEIKEVSVNGYLTQLKLKPSNEKYPDTLTLQRDEKLFTKVEVDASYPGGVDAWKDYLKKNLHANIPDDEGWKPGIYTIIIRFIVHADGTVSDVTAMNYEGSKTAQHCIDLIKKSSKWLPAMQNGRVVSAYRRQPITFVIEAQDVKKPITK